MGGLGNQMFQYAAGRAVSLQYNETLKLDIRSIGGPSNRKYELQHYNIKAEIVAPEEADRFRWKKRSLIERGARKILNRPAGLLKNASTYFRQKNDTFNENIFSVGKDVYLDGYWQNEKYFLEIISIIQDEFTLKERLSENIQELSSGIEKKQAVSVHFRRGDYINNPRFYQIYAQCPIEYYNKAIIHILKNHSDAHFFIFSDDPDWVKKHFHAEVPMTIIPKGNKSYEDLRLMTLCKHHIIANSSFSWWGAWLSPNSEKITIGPKKWFNDPDRRGINPIPDRWIKI